MNTPGTRATGATLIRGVRIFDGHAIADADAVLIEDGVISAVDTDLATHPAATIIDGRGATLLPGLIDAHIHLDSAKNLHQLLSFGVTTALDMATWRHELLTQLRGEPGGAEIGSAGTR